MIKNICLFALSIMLVFNVCSQTYRTEDKIFKSEITDEERSYLKFLYEYMPISDIADYDGDFFLQQVRSAIKARNTFSWGDIIPEDIFKHYVLVYRVNNENLDTARMFIFNRLKDRIKDMSMYDAALEVNHWCHEHVNYKASDGRTSSPLSTIRTSWGRCGEESTLTVTALRAVGIPARQCYTPRWAHTDDNHAWVEVWVDGKWYYLGACEPEPELNVAWFDAPVKRAMMVHTTVFGKYDGQEEKIYDNKLYGKINLLSNYTSTKRLNINVKDENGSNVENAVVAFGLYNYAEYYPLAKIKTDKNGNAGIETGFGDLVIWAFKDGKTARKTALSNEENVELVLKKTDFKPHTDTFVLYPPVQKAIKSLPEEKIAENAVRIAYEDSLRNAYINSFSRNQDSTKWIQNLKKWNQDSKTVNEIVERSWGNYAQIEEVLQSGDENAVKLLLLVYDKDLRDVPADVFMSHLQAYKNYPARDTALEAFVLNPRIQLEKITPYRKFLQDYFSDKAKEFTSDPQSIADWIVRNIKINNTDNYYGVQISPMGVLKIKECDALSREIFFVAVARSFGIASRYEWSVGKAQYRLSENSPWTYPVFEKEQSEPVGRLVVANSKDNRIKPEYYIHFTIQRLLNDEYKTLDFEYDPKFESFPDTLELAAGNYRMVSGNRDSDGNIFVREEYFEIKADRTSTVEVKLEEIKSELKVLGQIDLNTTISCEGNKSMTLKDMAKDKGLVLAIMDPYSEPVRHLMADIPLVKTELEQWGGGIVFAMTKQTEQNPETLYRNLPNQSVFSYGTTKELQKTITKAANMDFSNNYPLLCFISEKGEILFLSEGYRIGSGESILKVIHKLNQENNQ